MYRLIHICNNKSPNKGKGKAKNAAAAAGSVAAGGRGAGAGAGGKMQMSVGAHLQHMFPPPQFDLKGQPPERSMRFRKDLCAPSTKGPGTTTQVCVWGGRRTS